MFGCKAREAREVRRIFSYVATPKTETELGRLTFFNSPRYDTFFVRKYIDHYLENH